MAFRNLGRSLVAVLCVSIFLQVPVLGRRDIRQVSSRRANDRRTHSKKRLTSHSPPPQPPVSIPRQASLLNATQTILAGARGVGQDVLQYAPPLKEGVETQVKATAAQLAGVQFNPATADWSKIYTGFPQPQVPTTTLNFVNNVPVAKFPEVGGMKCLSNYAICAFANCTVSFASNPPVAECGCLPVQGGNVVLPGKPNGFPNVEVFSTATAAVKTVPERALFFWRPHVGGWRGQGWGRQPRPPPRNTTQPPSHLWHPSRPPAWARRPRAERVRAQATTARARAMPCVTGPKATGPSRPPA